MQHLSLARPGSARQCLHPGDHAMEVWRCEDRGYNHLLHLAGEHPAADLHFCPCGLSVGQSALLARPASLFLHTPVRVAQQQLCQLLVGRLAQCPLLHEGFNVLHGSLQSAQGKHLKCPEHYPEYDLIDLLRDVHAFPLPPIPKEKSKRDGKDCMRHQEARVPHLG